MRRTAMYRLVMTGVLAALATACQKQAPPPKMDASLGDRPAATRPGAMPDTSAPDESGAGDASSGITMRYACDQGHGVAIVRGETARVTLADGRVVNVQRVAGSSPPRYEGEALSFEVGSNGATLGQHEVGGFACREAD